MFGAPVKVLFKKKEHHPSVLGGVTSLILQTVVFIYIYWRLDLFKSRSRDDFYFSTTYREFHEIGIYNLTEKDMQFNIMIADMDYDNDDNPYVKIVLHKYINMVDMEDISPDSEMALHRDEIVPLALCDDQS